MRCLFCDGNFYYESSLPHTGGPGLMCHYCGRSNDLRYELYVVVEQMNEHCNQHTYGSSADYRYRRKMKLPLVDERGRKSKWE